MQGDCEATGNVFPHGAANSLPFALEEKKIIEVEANDALLRETKGRFVLFPLKFPNLWECYKEHQRAFWIAEDIDTCKDLSTLKISVSYPDRLLIIRLVEANIRFCEMLKAFDLTNSLNARIQSPEGRTFLGFQSMMENIHLEALAAGLTAFDRSGFSGGAGIMSGMKHSLSSTSELYARSLSPNVSFSRVALSEATILSFYSRLTNLWIRDSPACLDALPSLKILFERISADRRRWSDFAMAIFLMMSTRKNRAFINSVVQEAVDTLRKDVAELGIEGSVAKPCIQDVIDDLFVSLNLDELPPSQELPTSDVNLQISSPPLPRTNSDPYRAESQGPLQLDLEF